MSRIVGVACDNCGNLDVGVSEYSDEFRYTEDNFPRNGWISLNQWAEGDKMRYAMADGPEIHVCSAKCLQEFATKYANGELDHDHDQDHNHEH